MKMYNILIWVILTFASVSCQQPVKGKNGVAYKNAIDYNNYIITRQTGIALLVPKLSYETQHNIEAAGHTIDSAILLINKATTEIEGMPAWKGDSAFRDRAVRLLRFYRQTFANNYRRIIALQQDGNLSENERAGAVYLMAEANKAEYLLDADLKKAQQQFGIDNGLVRKKEK